MHSPISEIRLIETQSPESYLPEKPLSFTATIWDPSSILDLASPFLFLPDKVDLGLGLSELSGRDPSFEEFVQLGIGSA